MERSSYLRDDTTLQGKQQVKEEVQVVVNLKALHYDPAIWENNQDDSESGMCKSPSGSIAKKLQRWLLIAVRYTCASVRRDWIRVSQSFARKYGVRRMASPWKRRKCGYRVSELIGTSVMCIESAWVSQRCVGCTSQLSMQTSRGRRIEKLAAMRHWAPKVSSL